MLLPLLLANVFRDPGPASCPHDPVGISFFASSAISSLFRLPLAWSQQVLEETSTSKRLNRIEEILTLVQVQDLRPGTLLVSTRTRQDFAFGRSVVLVYQHGPGGTRGVIINQPLGPLGSVLYRNRTKPEGYRCMFGGPVSLGVGQRHRMILSAVRYSQSVQVLPGLFLSRLRSGNGTARRGGHVAYTAMPAADDTENDTEYELAVSQSDSEADPTPDPAGGGSVGNQSSADGLATGGSRDPNVRITLRHISHPMSHSEPVGESENMSGSQSVGDSEILSGGHSETPSGEDFDLGGSGGPGAHVAGARMDESVSGAVEGLPRSELTHQAGLADEMIDQQAVLANETMDQLAGSAPFYRGGGVPAGGGSRVKVVPALSRQRSCEPPSPLPLI